MTRCEIIQIIYDEGAISKTSNNRHEKLIALWKFSLELDKEAIVQDYVIQKELWLKPRLALSLYVLCYWK